MARGLVVVLTTLAFGLLGIPATAAGAAWVPFVLAALLVTVNSLGYAELASSTPKSRGAYSLVHRAGGDEAPAFLTGWALMLSEIGLCAVLAQAGAEYLAALMAAFVEAPIPLGYLASGVVIVATLGRFVPRPRRRGGKAPLFYLLGFAVLIVLAISRVEAANLRPARLDLQTTLPPLLVAFVGLELISRASSGTFAGETRASLERCFSLPTSRRCWEQRSLP